MGWKGDSYRVKLGAQGLGAMAGRMLEMRVDLRAQGILKVRYSALHLVHMHIFAGEYVYR